MPDWGLIYGRCERALKNGTRNFRRLIMSIKFRKIISPSAHSISKYSLFLDHCRLHWITRHLNGSSAGKANCGNLNNFCLWPQPQPRSRGRDDGTTGRRVWQIPAKSEILLSAGKQKSKKMSPFTVPGLRQRLPPPESYKSCSYLHVNRPTNWVKPNGRANGAWWHGGMGNVPQTKP